MMKSKFADCSSYGKLMLLIGLLVAVPLLMIPFYPEDGQYAISFVIPSLSALVLGSVVCLFGGCDNSSDRQTTMQRSGYVVLFAWGFGILMGSIPFVIGGKLTFVQALFESVSGWTTTGLSVMDVSEAPHIYLFFRSFTQFCGGLGFVMMMVMLISGKQSVSLFNAEGHPDKLMPNLKRTAQAIFLMYNGFLIVGSIAYYMAGMNWFESVLHSMCSLSTGGFSTRLGSIGEYQSLAVEIITIVLMLIGTTNFAVLLLAVKRKWRRFFKVSELRFMLALLLIFIPLTALSLANGLHINLGEGLRRAAFDVASALSTTGYSTMSYTGWPPFAIGILILMMLIGGGIGSTAGGMKLTRVYVLLRLTLSNLKKRLSPARSVEALSYTKAQGKEEIDASLATETVGFIGFYIGLFIVGSLLLTVTAECGLVEGMFEFGSALGTVGLSIGITGPATGVGTLLIEMCGMILGRLEIFIVFIGIHSAIKKIAHVFVHLRK